MTKHIGRKGLLRILVFALLTGCFLVPAAAQGTLQGEVRKTGIQRVAIAVPDASFEGPLEAEAKELARIVRADLEFSGFFKVIDRGLYNLVKPEATGVVPHDGWLGIGADTLVDLHIKPRRDKIYIQVYLYDNESQTTLLAQAYTGSRKILRRTAHWVADDLIKNFTGRPSVTLTRIAYVQKRGNTKDVHLMDYDVFDKKRLTHSEALNLSPAWSIDAKKMAYVSWRSKRPDIWIVDTAGNIEKAATIEAELTAAPDWSPDGTQMVYTSDRPGNSEIYVLNLKTRRNTRLTRSPAIDTAPAFSPNGREIAFVSDRSGNPQIYVMDINGLNVRRISRTGSYNESPAWSPDGSRLAYVSRVEGRFEVVIEEIGTGAVLQLTRGRGHKENPRWSPDGHHLVFSGNASGKYEIYTIRADGSGLRQITREGGAFTPDWSR